MTPEQYAIEVQRTNPKESVYAAARERAEEFGVGNAFDEHLPEAIKVGNDLDRIKKYLLYGKVPVEPMWGNSAAVPSPSLSLVMDKSPEHVHAILGIVTEGTELLEAMEYAAETTGTFDRTNLIEEAGDVLWYVSLLCDALGVSMSDVMDANIAKLRARFPDKFTEASAIDRDTQAERDVLESTLAEKS